MHVTSLLIEQLCIMRICTRKWNISSDVGIFFEIIVCWQIFVDKIIDKHFLLVTFCLQ